MLKYVMIKVYMNYFSRFFKHLHTINKHKFLVTSMCFKCGMISQGIKHDLSKYSPQEFLPSVKYFQGNRSPITYEKEIKGYSQCWLHHKGRNKHHWEYWTDRVHNELISYQMPYNYVLESVLDKIAASKVYKKNDYTDSYPLDFFLKSYEIHVMNEITSNQIQHFLTYLKENGQKKTLELIKLEYKKWKKDNNHSI